MDYHKQWLGDRIAWMDSQLGFDPNAVVLGDVNCDGTTDIEDVTALISFILTGKATGIDRDAADCNQDGSWDIADVTALISLVLNGQSLNKNADAIPNH